MRNLAHFSLGNVIKKLNAISVTINTEHTTPFPKPDCFLLSHFRFERRYIKIDPSGRIIRGLPRMISSLIDFSRMICLLPGNRPYHARPPTENPEDPFEGFDQLGLFEGRRLKSNTVHLTRWKWLS